MNDRLPRGTPPGAGAPGPHGATRVWTGHATGHHQWLLALLGVGALALGVVLAVDVAGHDGTVPLLMAVVGCAAAGILALYGTLSFVRVVVRVDAEALEVRCGHAGRPRRRIPLSEVVEADHVRRVTPRHWGGWGYRWRPGMGTAVVVRRGEGVVVRLRDGRSFTVTVDDAEAAVRAIRDGLRRPAPQAGTPRDGVPGGGAEGRGDKLPGPGGLSAFG